MNNCSNIKIQEAILKTLSYFDIFEYSLTSEELRRLLWFPDNVNDEDFFVNLQILLDENKIACKYSFYFLKDKKDYVKSRQLKVKLVEQKMSIAKRAIDKLRKVPFLRAVFVCNTVALGVPNNNSDIDVFIVTRKNYIWLVRFFSTIILKFFRLRTSRSNHKDRVCLSFYATDNNLNLERLKIKNKTDIYLVYWLLQLIPIYDPENLYISILNANRWLDEYVNVKKHSFFLVDYLRVKNFKNDLKIKNKLENFFAEKDYLINFLKKIQIPKIRKNYGLYADRADTRVVISDDFLKFHENDRRKEYCEKWLKNCESLM
ncbi:MAG: hypothetical protein COY69_00155 [Candidatus Magasanikbacteria bacterium CG_4_10_14_0_8_um_filter_32_14]|uniref:Polymerase nucleotidyl transferase domain-containing protein n=2 Tax=Candidatus Magasanikiibacteriota TaxID=1752731 RepID=A0A2M7RAZ8_9BACT|nr:MAG: hypothetical protein AUJ23_02205 [Candidatus Magasanikbacteria bacterium CG1_02_32_51]PIY93717.1 MAG: hypothetical protein COY69_00155 [Candidatus Magasanikbacteria bacterium CG_4_10_14_0_8_um_filter_32_14]